MVKVYPSKAQLPQSEQLAWKIAEMASTNFPIEEEVTDMVINRIIDNASVAIASINRQPVSNARSQALSHPKDAGATVFGMSNKFTVCAEWAAWANSTAVRELDYHDTFLAADYSHPGDNIPPLLAVAQQKKCTGAQLLAGIITAYEVHINLVKAICLHKHKIDHMAHLCPATAAGIGRLLNLDTQTIYQAVGQAVHTSFSTRQSRKGEISSWKAYVPGYSAKLGIEAVDRAMRGEKSPSPIYEGEDSVIAWMLDGPEAIYHVELPKPGEAQKIILESYTKEHSAEYQSQALIDLACKMRTKINNFSDIESIVIHTSHHTHYVIGTGSGDPQKFSPTASRETLDHSIMYIFAVALEDGSWHHVNSYTSERAQRKNTVELWKKISTVEDPAWTKRYHEIDPNKKAFGAKIVIKMKDGSKIEDEMALANAHPAGAKPFVRENYIHKFKTLTADIITQEESERFLQLVQRLPELTVKEVAQLNVVVEANKVDNNSADQRGIF